ncbi:MerR family transcriptional regulator [Kribbella qitaiheensis]|uniref:MerR family transcriptional regulator n=1 Tax=Kribbella qitaiheensis TaxID=1544730 RepID=A0A7G6X860_9ACTN|nr:MerR family transcriptional regulator [Kribbella qitaiheensis]QNE22425.1 MerR family transcriptional regulator [Kribbella qitaiheensis]
MDERYSIGELARRTGLTVKAIRFYSDRGLVPPTDRTAAGYRRYDLAAVARLDLIRTLRELGLDLATIRRILDRETALSDVAAAHAEALTVQIRTLRLRRAILTTVADRNSPPEALTLMHRLSQLSSTQRHHLITDFLDSVFTPADPATAIPADPATPIPAETNLPRPASSDSVRFNEVSGFAAARRSLTPELPDHPEPEQVEAWIELAELTQDPDFRSVVRRMADDYRTVALRPDLVARIHAQVRPALDAGVTPDSPEAEPFVTTITTQYAESVGQPDSPTLRRRLAAVLETANDPRWARYLHLLAITNGWEPRPPLTPTYDWTIRALKAA